MASPAREPADAEGQLPLSEEPSGRHVRPTSARARKSLAKFHQNQQLEDVVGFFFFFTVRNFTYFVVFTKKFKSFCFVETFKKKKNNYSGI